MDYLILISTPLRFAVAMTVFLSRQLMVIGPTPPGTGVIKLAFSLTCEKSTSPTIRYFPVSFSWVSILLIPTSMPQAPGFIQFYFTISARPTAAINKSAFDVISVIFFVLEWTIVTEVFSASNN